MPRPRASRGAPTDWQRARRARKARRRRRWAGTIAALVAANLGVQSVGVLGSVPPDPSRELLRAAALPAPDVAPPPPEAAPEPEPAPVHDSAIGGIEIPRLGLDVALHQGIEMTFINRGPSHWPGTALPGEAGNVVVAGHRVTKTRPFRHIDTLEVGDEVIFTVDGGRWVYRVTGHEVVDDQAMWITEQTATPTATLFACHPPGSAKFRWVTRLALDESASQPASGQPPAAGATPGATTTSS